MYYCRFLHDKLTAPAGKNKIRMVFGARQVGKTFLLNNIIPEKKSLVYNLQDSPLRRRLELDPSSFTRELIALPSSVNHIFVDEIQKVPALLDEIQFLYDKDHNRFQFYITGSSARKLRMQSANLLPGRTHLFNLYPVSSIEEKGQNPTIALNNIKFKPSFPERSLEKKLIFGNLPGVRDETDESAQATLAGYVDNYLEEEIRSESLIRNTISFSVFLRLAALKSGRQINLTHLSQESGIPISTIKNYYQVLVDTFTGYWINAYKRSGRKRLLTTPEFFIFDLGIRNAAANLKINETLLPEIGGQLLEHMVGLELIQRAGYLGLGYDVSFWRTVSGAEVDFVFETPVQDIPVEVKWTDFPQPKHAKNIEKFISLYPERAKKGYVVCRISRAQQLTEKVTAIPLKDL